MELAANKSHEPRLAAGLAVEAALSDPLTELRFAIDLRPPEDIHSFLDWARSEIALVIAATHMDNCGVL